MPSRPPDNYPARRGRESLQKLGNFALQRWTRGRGAVQRHGEDAGSLT